MVPACRDFELIIGGTFGPYTYAFNSTKSRELGQCTVVPGTDVFTLTAHGLVNTNQVRFKSTEVLPAPLVENQLYYIISATTDTFKVSLTSGGSAVDILDAGSGTHTLIKRGIHLDLTGWTFYSWVKQDLEDPDATLLIDLAPTIVSAANGLVQILKTVAQTTSLQQADGFHSLLGVKPTAERLIFTRGNFKISKVSTHPA